MSRDQDSNTADATDFKTDLNNGLSTEDVEKLRKKYGFNEIPEEKENPLLSLGKKFWGTTAWMLEVTAALTFVLKNYLDFYIIAALLVVNAVISFFQEERASGAVNLLKQSLQVKCRVLRNGKWIVEDAKSLVPGDVIRIRSGDLVPADASLVDGYLDVDQSVLTGESISVVRKNGEKVFSGSIIKKGESTAMVIATGPATYFGKTAELVQSAAPKLHINEVVSMVLKWLLAIAITLVAVSLIVWVIRGFNVISILPLLLVLLIAAIPVALPAMFTVSMALGSMDLIKKGILVTRLSSIEDAASMDILCTDKTGTITQNRLTIESVVPLDGYSEDQIVLYGAMASSDANNDAIDSAFLEEYRKRGLPAYSVEKFIPFDPTTRRTESDAVLDGKEVHIMKGAVKTIAALVQS
ncbi:plasma-membrane proton-efflux P-type ATPase, partial [mine drainage metagenome]